MTTKQMAALFAVTAALGCFVLSACGSSGPKEAAPPTGKSAVLQGSGGTGQAKPQTAPMGHD